MRRVRQVSAKCPPSVRQVTVQYPSSAHNPTRRTNARTGPYDAPTPRTFRAFLRIFVKFVTGAHALGVLKFVAVCSHSGDAVEAALNDKAEMGIGQVVKGHAGKARVVKWADGTKLAVPNVHLSMDGYWRTKEATARVNCDAVVDMFKVPVRVADMHRLWV